MVGLYENMKIAYCARAPPPFFLANFSNVKNRPPPTTNFTRGPPPPRPFWTFLDEPDAPQVT